MQLIVQKGLKLSLYSKWQILLHKRSFNLFWTIGWTHDINFGIFTLNLAIGSTPNTIILYSSIITPATWILGGAQIPRDRHEQLFPNKNLTHWDYQLKTRIMIAFSIMLINSKVFVRCTSTSYAFLRPCYLDILSGAQIPLDRHEQLFSHKNVCIFDTLRLSVED